MRRLVLALLFIAALGALIPKPLAPVVHAQAPDLTRVFASYISGSGVDSVRDVVADSSGNWYLTGGTASSGFPVTGGAFDTTFNGNHDVWVAKVNANGTLAWCTFLGGANYDRAYAIEWDTTGVYVAGRAGSGFPTTASALQSVFAGDNEPNSAYGNQDGFVAKLNLTGTSLLWSTFIGGPGREFVRDIDIDSVGDVYAVMADVRVAFPHISGGYDTTHGGGTSLNVPANWDAAICKINAPASGTGATTLTYGTFVGGNNYDGQTPVIRVNSSNEVWMIMGTDSTSSTLTATGGAAQTNNAGDSDLYLIHLSANGATRIAAFYFGGSGSEFMETHCLELDSNEDPVFAGTTKSDNESTFPETPGAFQTIHAGNCTSGCSNYNGDGFVAKAPAALTSVNCTYLGGSSGDGLQGISLTPADEVIVTGASFSANFPTTTGAFQTTKSTGGDMVLVKLNSALTALVYSTYYGGNAMDEGRCNAIDVNERIMLGGHSLSTNFPTLSPFDTDAGGDDGALVVFELNAGASNVAPTCNAGTDGAVTLPAMANLDGTAADDGLPNPPATLTTTWTQFSGPGSPTGVTFANANAQDTTATFTAGAGTYVLRLTADDSALNTTDNVTITVSAAASNVAPSVAAGSDQNITLPAASTLDATVSDDGLPTPPNLTTTAWTKVSGPSGGIVTFGNSAAVDTTASFSVNGTYVLRLTANDSALQTTDDIQITVAAAAGGSLPAGWLTADIGTVGVAGSSSESAGTFTSAGSGRDISGRLDGFRYTWQNAEYVSGDEMFACQVVSMGSTHPLAKAGAMIRQNISPGSKFAMMAITPTGAQFLVRKTYGPNGIVGGVVQVMGMATNVRAPYWVKVIRSGQTFSGHISEDGDIWTQVGPTVRIGFSYDTANAKGHCYIGMAVTGHSATVATTAVFDNVSNTFSSAGAWFYVAPGGSGTLAADNFATPSNLKAIATGSDVATITDLATVWGRDGQYFGRYNFGLAGTSGNRITVRGYPDEEMVINGPMDTVLTSAITVTTNTTFTVANPDIFAASSDAILIDSEFIKGTISGSTFTTTTRGFGGTTAATHLNGAQVRTEAPVMTNQGSFADYINMRVTVLSSTSRAVDNSTFSAYKRPTIIDDLGDNQKLINVFADNGGTSVTNQAGGTNSEIYGLIAMNQGMYQKDGPAGHNVYFQASTPKSLKETILGNSAANNLNVSSSSAASTYEGLVLMMGVNSSARSQSSMTITNNFCYRDCAQWGPDTGSDSAGTVLFTGNYFAATIPCTIQAFVSGTITGNTCVGLATSSGATMRIRHVAAGSAANYEVNNNKYYRGRTGLFPVLQVQGTAFRYNSSQGGSGSFWQDIAGSGGNFERTGCLYSSQAANQEDEPCFFHENTDISTAALPSVNATFCRINQYDTNRAHLIVFNWTGGSTVSVDFSQCTLNGVVTPFLIAGDIPEVRYAPDFWGDPVLPAFEYVSGNPAIPMTNRPAQSVIGHWDRASDTLPTFGVFVVLKK